MPETITIKRTKAKDFFVLVFFNKPLPLVPTGTAGPILISFSCPVIKIRTLILVSLSALTVWWISCLSDSTDCGTMFFQTSLVHWTNFQKESWFLFYRMIKHQCFYLQGYWISGLSSSVDRKSRTFQWCWYKIKTARIWIMNFKSQLSSLKEYYWKFFDRLWSYRSQH
jgi:hypothetical protein